MKKYFNYLPIFLVLLVGISILFVTKITFRKNSELSTQEKFFEDNKQAFEEIKTLALDGKLEHNDECASKVAFEVPQKYKNLFSDNVCIFVDGESGSKIIQFSVADFYKPIVYTQTPEKYKDKLWDLDGYDLKRTRDLGGNWFLAQRDWN